MDVITKNYSLQRPQESPEISGHSHKLQIEMKFAEEKKGDGPVEEHHRCCEQPSME